MEFYKDKLVINRKQNPLSSSKIAGAMGVSRTTYWKWETGVSIPNTKQVRMLADILEIPVSNISNLPSLPNIAFANGGRGLSENIRSWNSFFDLKENKNFQKIITDSLNASIKLSSKLNEAGIIIEALLSGIDSLFYIKNTELLYMTANNAFLKNLSLKDTFAVFGKTDEDVLPKKEARDNTFKDEQILITKKQSIEEGFIPGSKDKKWGVITRTPIFDLNGNIAGLITNIVDITDRKKAESKGELLTTCIESISEAVSIYNYTKEKTVYVNNSTSVISGYSLEEIYDSTNNIELNALYSEEEKKKTLEYRKNKRWPKSRDLQVICKDGTVKWMNYSVSSLADFMNNQYLVTIMRDISKEKNIKKQYSALIELFNAAHAGVLLRNDTSGEIFFTNDYYGDIFGYPTGMFIKDIKFRINTCVYQKDKEQEKKYLENNKYPKIRDYRIVKPDGAIRTIREISFRTELDGETYSGCMCRDFTDLLNKDLLDLYGIAKTLKKRNVSVDIISEATGLSIERIKEI